VALAGSRGPRLGEDGSKRRKAAAPRGLIGCKLPPARFEGRGRGRGRIQRTGDGSAEMQDPDGGRRRRAEAGSRVGGGRGEGG